MANDNVVEFVIQAKDEFSPAFVKLASILTASVATSVVVVGAAFFTMVKSVADAEAHLGTLAKMASISAENMSALAHAALLSDSSIEGLANGLKFMQRAMSEANQGNAQMTRTFQELGFSALDPVTGKTKDANTALFDLADRFESITDPAERTALAIKIFGRGAQETLRIIADGSEGLRKMAVDAEFLGVTLSTQAVANAKAFNDQMTRVNQAVVGASRAIADQWIPAFTGLAHSIADNIAGWDESLKKFSQRALDSFLFVFVTVQKVFSAITAVFEDAFRFLIKTALQARSVFTELTEEEQKFIDNSRPQELLDRFNVTFAGISKGVEDLKKQFFEYGEVRKQVEADVSQQTVEARFKQFEAERSLLEQRLIANIHFAEQDFEVWNNTIQLLSSRMQNFNEVISTSIAQTFEGLTAGIGDAVGQAIVHGENMRDAFNAVAQQVLVSLIAMLVKYGVQRLLLVLLNIGATVKETSAALAGGLAAVYVNSLASAAAIPVIGWAIAPGVAAANLAVAAGGAAAAGSAGAGIGAALGGVAHGGMTSIPDEMTFLLQRGERVLSPEQNKDLTSFMQGSGGGVSIGVVNIHVLENATNVQTLLDMSDRDVREIVAAKLIPALNSLDRQGIRPNAAQRSAQ